ncbi:glutamate racemase [Candidatus Saccharibacteria bacterium]|nr:glutamate racemase [Candidatus Saccharibacteria bacterium]
MATKHRKIKIGVFDSGVGGLSIANYIEKHLPNVDVRFVNDTKNVPYGDKPIDLVYSFVLPIIKKLEKDGCQVIVLACNTVTTNLIDDLRKVIKVPLVGLEPMVKSAAQQTQSKIVAICATPATLASKRYVWLVDSFAKDVSILEPDCSNWSRMIESSEINHKFIKKQIKEVCDAGADVIVLGCTHYHWIEEEIKIAAEGRALVLQPEQSVARRLTTVIDGLKIS